jgi:hypothetical protein
MNKAFRRSLLSLTAASAMATSSFAGNAAYLDIKLNYLNTDNTVMMGIDDDSKANSQRDRVEILVSILDKDGNLATKDKDGKILSRVEIKRNSQSLTADSIKSREEAGSITQISNSGNTDGGDHLKLFRAMKESKNVDRFVLDYTNFVSSKLTDTLVIAAGSLEREVTIDLSVADAEGLVLRVSKLGDMKNSYPTGNNFVEGMKATDKGAVINANFSDINITDDNDLGIPSDNVPNGVAGDIIPLKVYASIAKPGGSTSTVKGKFTLAPNLEGKTIVVQAMGSYDINATAKTVLGSVELTMKNGVAFGEIKIDQGLPGKNVGAAGSTATGVTPNAAFGTDYEGLGVAFVTYVKDDVKIANLQNIDLEKMTSTFPIAADNGDTDTLVIRSLDPVGLKVGLIDNSAKTADKLWIQPSKTVYTVDVFGSALFILPTVAAPDSSLTLTVVDSLGNPAILSKEAEENYLRFDGYDDESRKSDRFTITTAGPIVIGTTLNSSMISTTTTIDFLDGLDKNGSATEELSISFAKGSLSGMDPVKVNITNLVPIESEVSGSPLFADVIETNVSTRFINGSNYIVAGLVPFETLDLNKTTREFTAKLKILKVAESNTTMTLGLSIIDPEKPSEKLTNFVFGRSSGNVSKADFGNAAIFEKNKDDVYEFNISNGLPGTYNTIEINATTAQELAHIIIDGDLTGKGFGNLQGDSVKIKFKAFENKRVRAYAKAHIVSDEDDFAKEEIFFTGDELVIDFSGEAVNVGDDIELEFNTSLGATFGKVGLANEPYSEDLDLSIITTLNEDKQVIVKLYETNASSNKPGLKLGSDGVVAYKLLDIKLNGMRVVYSTQNNDKDTDNIYEFPVNELFTTGIYVTSRETKDSSKIRIDFKQGDFSNGSGEGLEDDDLTSLPTDVRTEMRDFNTTEAVTLKEEVKTGLYYAFFNDVEQTATQTSIATVLDAYGNLINTGETNFEDNFEVTCTSGIEFSTKDGEGFIKFKPEAAGTEQVITMSLKVKPEVVNTIVFTNIKEATQNTKFDIMQDIKGPESIKDNHIFNVVNSEVVIKVVGNNGSRQEDTEFTVVSDNKDAKVKLVPLALTGNFFKNMLDSKGVAGGNTIGDHGSYYFVTSDKPGKVTISVKSQINKDISTTKEEVIVTGTQVVNFVAVDLDAPIINTTTVTAIPSGIRIEIKDANLDTAKTEIFIKGVDNDFKADAEYQGNGVYIASGLAKGQYSIGIEAIDLAGNIAKDSEGRARITYVRNITEGETALSPEAEVATVLNGQTLEIVGEFTKISGDDEFAWGYTDKATSKTFKLMGDKAADTDKNPFGFSEAELTIDANAEKWYMVKLTGQRGKADAAGKFGWAMVKSDGSIVKKIDSMKSNGSFNYLNTKISANISNGKITFSK